MEGRSLYAADLACTELELGRSALVRPGESFTYSVTVANLGTSFAQASNSTTVLSRDRTIGNYDDVRIVGASSVPALSGLSEYRYDVQLTALPAWVTPGRYFLARVTDSDNAVRESNEQNNIRWSRTFIVVPDQTHSPTVSLRWLGPAGLGPILPSGDSQPTAAKGTLFKSADRNGAEVHTFEIRNTGNLVMYIFDLTSRLSSPSVNATTFAKDGWTVVKRPPAEIQPGGSGTFQIRFKPGLAATEYIGAITLLTSDIQARDHAIIVRGKFGAPRVRTSIAGDELGTAASGVINLGSAGAGTQVSIPVRLTNIGPGPLNLNAPRLSATTRSGTPSSSSFLIANQPSLSPIFNGQSRGFSLVFSGVETGTYEVTLSLSAGKIGTPSWKTFVYTLRLTVTTGNAQERA